MENRLRRQSRSNIRPMIIISEYEDYANEKDSPSYGVPPPIDQPVLRSIESSSDSSCTEIEIISMKAITDKITHEIQTSFTDFRRKSTENLGKQLEILTEKQTTHEEIDLIKGSLGEILLETNKTRDEIKEMKSILEEELGKSRHSHNQESLNFVEEELTDLKIEISKMNLRLNQTEEELTLKSQENNLLQYAVSSLQESLSEYRALTITKSSKCKLCVII